MKWPFLYAAILPAVLVASPSAAQTVDSIHPGRAGLPQFHLVVGATVDQVSMVGADGTSRQGPRSTKEISEVAYAGKPCYLIVMVTPNPRGPVFDSVWAVRGSMELVRHVEGGMGGHTEVNVRDGRLRGTVADSGQPVRTIDVPAPVFDYSVADEMANQLPLKTDYRAFMQAYDVAGNSKSIAIHVLGAEEIDTPAGKRAAWQVEFDFGTHKAIRWIDQKTRRGLQWKVDMGNGRGVMWGHSS